MGVPKFFRYISERYPCLSELVKEYQIPEFDNLYLDMNGIIHMCSHPDDGNPHFRITEEKIFKDIFHYIEVLFRMIKPQKLFFMAVDGVAPRAKMNQQRGRRFRSAKDAEKQENDALKKGEVLPEEARFDSNCITPGTVFMARLQEQLKYFVVEKISNDPSWQKCKVILSGHETPGEGEHKIMDYIRYMRAQPGYDPNTRHCLYGLDADLIMLGLCTHEPHFSLLREEVKFGKKSTKRMSVPEEITFYLLHLSLMREYLELEFAPLKNKLRGFDYDFEKIIDDWVLMGFLVGNDFIPHLPNLHIANGALPVLYKAYMDILPSLNGYINEAGALNLERFELFMEKLGQLDLDNFEEIRDDLLYMEEKTGRKYKGHSKVSTNLNGEELEDENESNEPSESLESEHPRDSGLAALIKETETFAISDEDEETETSQSEEDEAFINYKREYYRNKLEYKQVTPEVMRDQAEGYVRAIQWNLNYYYNGCCSWSWYYPHHYAPYISDIKGFSNLKIEFDLGKPFLPYEQLLGVLPTASKNLLPRCYHELMTEENSLIKKYYPDDFQTDLNGKKQDWEAVVLVPFIDENLLLEAMSYCNDKLTTEEKNRNSHGPMLIYMYTPRDQGRYAAPDYFPELPHNYTEVKKMLYSDIRIPKEKLVKGAYPGVKMNVFYPGFPTMKHLKYKGELMAANVKVFETPSRHENMIISIIPNQKFASDAIPVDLLGTTIFVGWPHLVEAKVIMISNAKRKFISMGGPGEYNAEDQPSLNQFSQEIQGITEYYRRRLGINFGETKVLVHVQVMIGRKYIFSPNGRITLEKQFATNLSHYPLQTIVFNISAYDSHQSIFKDVEEIFRKGSICYSITNPHYGSQGVVKDIIQTDKSCRVKIVLSVLEEPNFSKITELYNKMSRSYKTSYGIASQLAISNNVFSRITGSVFISLKNNSGEMKHTNIGLDLKMNKKNKEIPGYTKKIGNTWYYTEKSGELVKSYANQFPEVFFHLSNNPSFDNINVEKIFGDDYENKLKELQCWLKSLPIHTIERQTCGSSVIEPEVVEEIEKIVDNFKVGNVKKLTMTMKPNFLYKPEIQSGTLLPDPKMNVKILDRIVNVRMGFTVPFGLKGTVIGIQVANTGSERDIMYDVVFDKPFKDGMKLNCSEDRGYRVPKTSFINISYGQRLLVEKTGETDELISKAQAIHSGNENAREQPSLQQQWLPPQLQTYAEPPPNQTNFNQSNSAFAHFTGAVQQKMQPTNHQQQYESIPDKKYNSKPLQSNNTKENTEILRQESHQEKSCRKLEETKCENKNRQQQQVYTWQTASDQLSNSQQQIYPSQTTSNQFLATQKESSTRRHDSKQWQNKPYQNVTKHSTVQQHNSNKYNQSQLYQICGNDRQPQSSNQVISLGNDCFMPVFKNGGKFGGLQEKEQNKMTQTVNTNILQKLLKIGENPKPVDKRVDKNEKLPPNPNIDDKNVITSQIPIGTFMTDADTPASIKLLTYYQTNSLGLPRYQYFTTHDKLTQAQITLADGKVIVGTPAPTKEIASENVASDVLRFLSTEKQAQGENIIPSPPETWVRQENDRHVGQKKKTTLNNPMSDSKPSQKNSSETTAVLNNSFVPLQAVKSHIIKTKQMEESVKENIRTQKNVAGISNEERNVKEPTLAEMKKNKPKKQRKTRIAANFLNKK
ncbi:5'-3' exoribonuclease pacman isoform X2 [Leptinotarsa decemlineata]|uniref:5'-3' exoribonuclease pacman isoform X2 n=1 Tax=Leptinotarsa decemlineata TaxID=7539 RepID=UPI003D30455B